MDDKLLWWGYIHTNGSTHLKRYFGPLDIEEAHKSPFCKVIFNPFPATNRDDAMVILNELVGERKTGVDE